MHFYINYINKDLYSIYLLVFLISIFIIKILNSTKLTHLFNRFKYSMTNFFPGISEEEKALNKSNYINLFNFYWFLSVNVNRKDRKKNYPPNYYINYSKSCGTHLNSY